MRVNAYGLSPSLEGGKAYHVWMQPQSGDPVDIGVLEADQNGSGFAIKLDLPPIDQGKSVMLTMDAQDAKRAGDVVASADLPKLKPTPTAAPPQAQAQPGEQAPATQTPQAKSGGETQQKHTPASKNDPPRPQGGDAPHAPPVLSRFQGRPTPPDPLPNPRPPPPSPPSSRL